MRGARKLGVEQTGVLLTYWQRLKRRLGILSRQSRAQLLCLQARPGLRRVVGAVNRPLWTRLAGLLGRQTASRAVKTRKKVSQ